MGGMATRGGMPHKCCGGLECWGDNASLRVRSGVLLSGCVATRGLVTASTNLMHSLTHNIIVALHQPGRESEALALVDLLSPQGAAACCDVWDSASACCS